MSDNEHQPYPLLPRVFFATGKKALQNVPSRAVVGKVFISQDLCVSYSWLSDHLWLLLGFRRARTPHLPPLPALYEPGGFRQYKNIRRLAGESGLKMVR